MSKTKNQYETVSLSLLTKDAFNVRTISASEQSLDSMIASITAEGVMLPLLVRPVRRTKKLADQTGDDQQRYTVYDGGRRLEALQAMVARGDILPTYPVPVMISAAKDAVAASRSLAANEIREAMHAADKIQAYKTMHDKGASITDIAIAHGAAESTVAKMLRLANTDPKVFEAFKAGLFNMSVLQAFAGCTDHGRQRRVFAHFSSISYWDADSVRRQLRMNKMLAGDAKVKFVGLVAYGAAGGDIGRDLFIEGDKGEITHPEIIETLAAEKLEAAAAALREEGWGTVEITDNMWQSTVSLERSEAPISPEAQVRLDEIEARLTELYAHEKHGDIDNEETREIVELETEQARLEYDIAPEDKAACFAFVGIDQDGCLEIARGLYELELEQEEEEGEDEENPLPVALGDEADTDGDVEDARPSGGNVIAFSSPAPVAPVAKPMVISERLKANLTANYTEGLRAVVMDRPDAAMLAFLYTAATQVFGGWHDYEKGSIYSRGNYNPPLTLKVLVAETACYDDDLEASSARIAVMDRYREWAEILPRQDEALWNWLVEQDSPRLMELFSFLVALTVNGIQMPYQLDTTPTVVASARLAKLVSLDMRDWWQPTSAAYFMHLTKAQIAEVVQIECGESFATKISKYAKPDMADAAADRLMPQKWLPEQLARHEPDEPEAVTQVA
jgi:ParB family chromosome partitioning protein